MKLTRLLSPGKIGSMELQNRFVVPPMGTNFGTYEGDVTDDMIAYYRRRAKGGFGLIIIEVTTVDRKGKAILGEVGLWDDEQIPMFKKLVDAIHEEGAKVVIELHHAGRQSVPPYIFGEIPEAPSKVACPVLNFVPEAMSTERVREVIEEFGDAAVRAKKAGADGVEVHGAHGYLVAQFMSPHANKRTDEYGGDFFGRMRFPQEVFANIRSKVGNDYPMLFRFGHDEKVHGGRTLEESVMVARMAEEAGVDALHVSIMTYASTPYMSAPPEMPHGFNQFHTKVIKEAVSIPVILATGGTPLHIDLEGIDNENVMDAVDVLSGDKNPGLRVLVIDGGMTGVETADYMAEHNKAVTIVEMRPDITLDEAAAPRFFLIPRLKEHGVSWITNATVKKILPDGAIYEHGGNEYCLGGFDTIVLALGVHPCNPLEEAVNAMGKEVYVIGDAVKAGPANKATEAGLEAALML